MQKSKSDASFNRKLPHVARTTPDQMFQFDTAPGYPNNSFSSSGFKKTNYKGNTVRQAETEAFLERQMLHPRVKWRRDIAAKTKKIVEASGFADDCAFWGAKGVEGFRTFLRSKYGSVVGGWRHGLDQDGNGKLSKFEFTHACRAMGYHGKLKTLWEQLDENGSGFVSLQELDPESGRVIVSFKKALVERYGNMISAWREGLDVNGNGTLDEEELVEFCRKINFQIDAHKLFRWLQPEIGRKKMGLRDLDPKAWDAFNAGDMTMKYAGPSNEWMRSSMVELPPLMDGSAAEPDCEPPVKSPSTSALPSLNDSGTQEPTPMGRNTRMMKDLSVGQKWRNSLARREMEAVKQDLAEIQKMRAGLHTKEGFKEALVGRCGSLLGAWKYALDLDGNGRISEGEFALALRRLGFHGTIRSLWRLIDTDGDGVITFGDLDEETDGLLKDFQSAAEWHYGNLLLCWLKGMDSNGTGKCDDKQFAKICKEIGYEGSPAHLFRLMQPEAGRRFLTLQDFDTKSYDAFSRGDFRMLAEAKPKEKKPVRKSKMNMSFHERQSSVFFHTFRQADEMARGADFAKACRFAKVPERLIDTLAEYKELLCRKYGSLMGAWRNLLDSDGSGKITFNEFCQATRSIGYGGNLKDLYAEFDTDNSGFISLKELDKDAYEAVEAFNQFLQDKYGSLGAAWARGFGKTEFAQIDLENFSLKIKEMGWEGEGRKLFKLLVPEAGRNYCNLRDLDPEQSHTAKKRGRQQQVETIADKDDSHGIPAGPISTSTSSSFNKFPAVSGKSQFTAVSDAPGPCGLSTLDALRKHLVKIYGSTVAAWRAAFDKPKRGRIHFGNFALALQDASFLGSAKKLWGELAKDCGEPLGPAGTGGFACLADLDPKAAKSLVNLREALVKGHGTIVDSWWLCLDMHGAGRIEDHDFIKAMETLRKDSAVGQERPKHLFKLLIRQWGMRFIALDDLEVLLLDVPASERRKVWGGIEAEPLSPRAIITQDLSKEQQKCKGASTLEGFKRALINQYGSLYAAWRNGLDVDRNGIITQADFAKGCRAIGYTGNALKLWKTLDKNNNGQIELKEIDPDVGEMVGKFEGLLKDQFGSVLQGWKKGLDQDCNRRLDQEEFVEKIKNLGFEGNAKRLFKLLQPEVGRKFITLDDLGPDERQARNYGD